MYEQNKVVYAGEREPMIRAKTVCPLEDYKLLIDWSDGRRGIFDMKPLLDLPCYRAIKDAKLFKNVFVERGTAVWSDGQGGETDIAPETLYSGSIDA